ncbi:MAG: arginine--tRNA ligase [Mycoplasmataceae bacterium]|nr:arginine--tRNA ligase [Mycoplasmataceae bacterium]
MKKQIEQKIQTFIQKELKLENIEVEVLATKKNSYGDYSTNLPLKLSKIVNKSPLDIAEQLLKYLEESNFPEFEKITVTKPGFVNFFLSLDYLVKNSLYFLDKKYKPEFIINKQKINYEFISANPTGDLHIGHARNAIVGDITINLLQYIGHEVKREYYINDAGNQINELAKSVYFFFAKELNKDISLTKEDVSYNGIEIKEYGILLAKTKAKLIKLSEEEAIKKIQKLTLKYFLKEIKTVINALNIPSFDFFTSEQSFYDKGKVDQTITQLIESKHTYEKDGALWLKTSDFGDDKDRVLVKQDKTLTYMVPDIANHVAKLERGFNQLIDLWGTDHHGYETRIRAALVFLGYKPEQLEVNFINMVKIISNNEEFKMSKRKGTSLRIKDVLKAIDSDLLRFFIVSKSKEQSLSIDVEFVTTKNNNNPFYYFQYANARVNQILEKYKGQVNKKLPKLTDKLTLVGQDEKERSLLLKMVEFEDIIYQGVKDKEPYILVVYLKELAQEFNSYYNYCIVIGKDNKLTEERILLMMALKNLFQQILALLGITPINKM